MVSFEAVERIGETYTVTIQLTHPLELDRADYLNKDATFLIDAGDGSEPRKFVGCITRFSKTRQTRDFSGYEIVVEPLVARLKLTRASRIYQQQTAPQIIEAILRRHGPKGHQFAFKLRRKYAQHRFRMQYELSDLAYIRLLCEQEGLYFYFTPGKFGEMVVFGDDIDHYIYQPELHVPYRETAGLESGQEAVFSLKMHAKTIPESGGRQPFFNALPAYVFVFEDSDGDSSAISSSTEQGHAITCFLSPFDAVIEAGLRTGLRTALGQPCQVAPASILNGNLFRDADGAGFIADIHLGWPARDGCLLQTPRGAVGRYAREMHHWAREAQGFEVDAVTLAEFAK